MMNKTTNSVKAPMERESSGPPPFHMRCDTPMELYRWQTWATKEPETIAWIDSFEPNTCFWDVGANIGIYSLYCGSLNRNIRVLAFEPHEGNNTKLHLNRDESRFTEHPEGFAMIEVLKFALGNEVAQRLLYVPDHMEGATGAQVNTERGWPVDVETIDHLVNVFPGYPTPDYLKIDIDGNEIQVLQGAARTLLEVKSVLVEVSKASKVAVWYFMRAAGLVPDDSFNLMTPHSRERRAREKIDAENIVFTRR